MSRRNKRDAKAARRKDRKEPEIGEPGHVFERVAEAVHQAGCEITGSDGDGLASAYGLAGARGASFFGGEMVPQAGELFITTGSGEQSLGHWAWMARIPEGHTLEALPYEGGLQIADFAWRHIRRAAEDRGVTWDRKDLAPWFWGNSAWLDSLGVRYAPEPGGGQLAEEILSKDVIGDIVALAISLPILGIEPPPRKTAYT